MSIPGIPVTSALNWWSRIEALQRAARYRMLATGSFFWWPTRSKVWAQGTVPGGVTLTGMSTGQTWDTTKDNPWLGVNKSTPDLQDVPTSWRIVFDHCDADKVVQADITTLTNGGVLTWPTIVDYVTSAQITGVSDLIGRTWYIVRGDRHWWWSDRVMDWPNAREHAKGTVNNYFDDPLNPLTITNPTTSSIKDADGQWIGAELVGQDLLLYAASDNLLKRVTVLTADDSTRVITFAVQAWTPKTASPYCVVSSGARAYPGRGPFYAFTFYRGWRLTYVSHRPDDTISSAELPASTATLPLYNPDTLTCGLAVRAWDRDVYVDEVTEDDLLCGAVPDKHYTPRLYKTFRDGIQIPLEDASWFYVEDKSYDTEIAIPLINPAVMFSLAGINAFTSSTTTVQVTGINVTSNTINFSSVAFPFFPIEVHFAVRRANGDYNAGFGLATSNTQLSAYSPNGADVFEVANDESCTLILSLGWTRFARREFRRLYPKTCFVPDTTDGGAIDPPAVDFGTTACLGAGTWERRPASTLYLDPTYPQSQFPDAKGEVREGIDTFVNGDLARYAGDNFANPSIRATGEGKISNGSDPLVTYYDHFVNVTHPRDVEAAIRSQLSGKASYGSQTQLTDEDADWWEPQWYAGGVLRTETGTFTGGSSTSGTDSSKTAGGANCFWAAIRFNGFDPYVGFVVEVLISGTDFADPAAVIEKRLIATGNDTGVTITWTPALSASANGKQYRIREPMYELNRYEGRTITFAKPDPANPTTTLTAASVVRGNDDVTLFFDSIAWAVDSTTSYSIDDPRIGGVWKRAGGAWTVPSGADAVRTGVVTPVDFHASQFENLPSYVKRYGPMMVRDAVCKKNVDEVAAVLAVLKCTRRDVTWTANSEGNERTKIEGNNEGESRSWSTLQSDLATAFPSSGPSTNNAAPFALSEGRISLVPSPDTGKQIEATRRYAYAQSDVPQPHCPISNTIKWYSKATTPGVGPPPGACVNDDLGGGDIRHIWQGVTFNANGDAVLENQFKTWATTGASTTSGTRTSPVLGTIALPGLVNDPVATAGACFTPTTDNGVTDDYLANNDEGYVVTGAYAVVCWTFSDL